MSILDKEEIREIVKINFALLASDIVEILIALEIKHIETNRIMVLNSEALEELANEVDVILYERLKLILTCI